MSRPVSFFAASRTMASSWFFLTIALIRVQWRECLFSADSASSLRVYGSANCGNIEQNVLPLVVFHSMRRGHSSVVVSFDAVPTILFLNYGSTIIVKEIVIKIVVNNYCLFYYCYRGRTIASLLLLRLPKESGRFSSSVSFPVAVREEPRETDFPSNGSWMGVNGVAATVAFQLCTHFRVNYSSVKNGPAFSYSSSWVDGRVLRSAYLLSVKVWILP